MSHEVIFRLNKRVVTKEDEERANTRGYRLLHDTLTEEHYKDGLLVSSYEWFIYTGRITPYGMCVKHGDYYVIARWSRYDSIKTDLSEYNIDCDETGIDDDVFETKHIKLENGKGVY